MPMCDSFDHFTLFAGKPASTPTKVWQAMTDEFPNDERLRGPAIYAIPAELIDAMKHEKIEALSSDDEAFERRLAQLSGAGLFLGRPFSYPGLAVAELGDFVDPKQVEEIYQRNEALDQQLDQLIRDDIAAQGGTDGDADSYREAIENRHESMHLRRLAYAAWLATDSVFRDDRDVLYARWSEKIDERGQFPSVPISLLYESPSKPPEDDRDFQASFLKFYLRWGIETMATWDLPVPMRSETLTQSFYHLPSVASAGITVFVPWYMFRDQELKLRDIADQQMLLHQPNELNRWLQREDANWGYERYQHMLKLFVWLELALRRRYPNQLVGKQERLDHAFAACLYGSAVKNADSVKKLRQEMQRRLTHNTGKQ